MNVEEPQLRSRVRGPKRVRGSAAGNVVELEHDVAPEKCGVACALSKPTEQKKSHWTVPAPALLSPPMQPSAKAPQQSSPSPGDPGEESVQTQFSEARPHSDGLHSRGNQSRAGMLCRLRADSQASRPGYPHRHGRMRLRQNANNRARHKRSENQIHRTRVREVRIQFPPAESLRTIGSSAAAFSSVYGRGSGSSSRCGKVVRAAEFRNASLSAIWEVIEFGEGVVTRFIRR